MDWNTIGSIAGLVAFITGGATGYLKLFVSREIANMKSEILQRMSSGFISRELVDNKFDEFHRRIEHLEQDSQPKRR